MSVSLQLGLLVIAIGLLPGSLGAFAFLSRRRFLRTACTASGVVEEMVLKHLTDGNSYQPKITFITQTGEKVQLTSVGMSNPPQFRVGQRVSVLYNPNNPHNARIQSFTRLWFVSLLFGGLGTLIIVIGLMLIVINN